MSRYSKADPSAGGFDTVRRPTSRVYWTLPTNQEQASQSGSPFAEITDDDIDNLFSD